ncbi:IclR family transcriptional regulator [Salinibacterium sp. ZJ450]|uniref:IclR family transcriptional regulator n=1 Tax=Salinibacterium sp. ZJ450 TaxID=2708338 RepID=UPI0014220F59|nr:helix-turn-helix domain-containing protein [Salinibacterium sp. ZJ450]
MTIEKAANAGPGGAQTLARGILALQHVAESGVGLSTQEVADLLGVHRTISYRILSTLAEANLIAKGKDGRYRGAAGLLKLSAGAYLALRETAVPIMRDLANELASTVSLLVPEGNEAVAIAVVEPQGARYHIAFAEGSRHPLDRGAAGHAIRAQFPPIASDPEPVRRARELGYARTFGEVEPGAHGLAVPCPALGLTACLNLITYREDVVDGAVDRMIVAAREISAANS